jgi:hypothetical protein
MARRPFGFGNPKRYTKGNSKQERPSLAAQNPDLPVYS